MTADELQGGTFTVVEGRDGWLFLEESDLIEVMRLYTDASYMPASIVSAWQESLRQRHKYFADLGITYLTVVAPDACLVYPEQLPAGVKLADSSPYTMIAEGLDAGAAAECIYPIDRLVAGKSEHPTFRREDSHWTDWGAFLTYQMTMQHLAGRRPDIEMLDPDRIRWSTQPVFGALGAVMDDERIEMVRVAEIVDSTCRVTQRVNNEVRDGFFIVEQDRPELPSAVIFRDSFMNSAAKFFSESFRRTVYCTNANSILRDLVERERPDVVLMVVAERRLFKEPVDSHTLDFRAMFGDLLMDERDAFDAELTSRALLRAGDAAAALVANDAAAVGGASARWLLQRSRCYIELGNLPAVLEALRAAVLTDPDDAPVRHEYARCLRATGHLEQALSQARTATDAEPWHSRFWPTEISLLIETKDVEGALERARSAVALHPRDSHVRFAFSSALIAAGALDEALVEVRKALDADPDSLHYRRLLASVLVRLEQWPEAESAFSHLVSVEPDQPLNVFWLEMVQGKLGRTG